MKIVIIGTGATGAILADLIQGRGHTVLLLEKEWEPGGMARSFYLDGFTYEYGPHILGLHHASDHIKDYLLSKIEVIETQLTGASFIKGIHTYYPPSMYAADQLNLGAQVRHELSQLPEIPDETNFETYMISKVGPTLYHQFYENFTEKFWQQPPKSLSADFAKLRRLGDNLYTKKGFFNERWCSYPIPDWNALFRSLLRGQKVQYGADVVHVGSNCVVLSSGNVINCDLIVSTQSIDRLFGYTFGELKYSGYDIRPVIIDRSYFLIMEGIPISMTYFPEADIPYCRVTDYSAYQHKADRPGKTIVTYEYPTQSKSLYPVPDKANLDRLDKYIKCASAFGWLISCGRLGLYRYLTIDTTVAMVERLLNYIDMWLTMSNDTRYSAYRDIRGEWNQ